MTPTQTFIQEAVDGLEEIETLLLSLEDDPTPDAIDALFRAMHTIKGSGAMFGFDALARFTHTFETGFDLVRGGRLSLNRALIDISLAACDHMAKLLHANDDPGLIAALEADPDAIALSQQITDLVAAVSEPGATTGAATDTRPVPATETAPTRYAIRYTPAPESLRNGARPDLLIEELAGLGTLAVHIDTAAVPPLDTIDPTACYLGWVIDLTTPHPQTAIRDVFVFVDEDEYTVAPVVEAPPEGTPSTAPAKADKPLVPAKSDTVKVPAARLDDLMDQLGELVIAQTRLAQLAGESADTRMTAVAEEVDRLINGLRDSTLAMRMLPIESVFGKFRRVVRTLADELGKEVTLVTAGGDTELDKTVIDSLSEPLVHMIRNSMDHGIEGTEERAAAGKSTPAQIGLTAKQSGGEVHITVSDDGRGLDDARIIAKARDRGLIGPNDDDIPPRQQLHQLIFEPAFSTAETLSNVSGRGVGMDAVRSVVSDLRGSIHIAAEAGQGTAITLRLPVTLAIIDGLLVRIGGGVFVMPLAAVLECVELNAAEYARKSGRTLLKIRDEMVPFVKLDALFGLEPHVSDHKRVVIVSMDDQRVGLVVDDVLGQHQTVIKTLSPFHSDIPGFAGSTILGDGGVALIMDIPALLHMAQERRNQPTLSAA